MRKQNNTTDPSFDLPQTSRIHCEILTMASEKRHASGDHGNSQMVVKRQNVGKDSKAVAVVNGSAANGALIQSVCKAWST